MPAPKIASSGQDHQSWPSPVIQPEAKRPVLEAAEGEYRRLTQEKRILDSEMDRITLDCEHARQMVSYVRDHPQVDAIVEKLIPIMAKLRGASDAEAPKA